MVIQRIIVSANTEFLCDVIFVTYYYVTIMMLCDLHKIMKSVTKFWIRTKRATTKSYTGTSWIRIKHFNVVPICGKISQNEKKMRQYVSLKDVIQNIFGLLRATCHARPLFCELILVQEHETLNWNNASIGNVDRDTLNLYLYEMLWWNSWFLFVNIYIFIITWSCHRHLRLLLVGCGTELNQHL